MTSWPWRRLGAAPFFAAVLVLAANDHVLKYRFPGWWTGKLSDVAGLMVVAVVLSLPFGDERAVAAAGLAFIMLKTVPGVAELAAPVLGGVTRRDPTDLIALAGLVPALLWLRHHQPRKPRPRPALPNGMPERSDRGRARTTASAVLPLVGAMVAMVATTATSCAPRPVVRRVVARGDSVYAEVVHDFGASTWARSADGGRTWSKTEAPAGLRQTSNDPYGEEKPVGPSRSCAPDGTCYRLTGQRSIARTSPGSGALTEFELTDAQFDAISTQCADEHRGVLTSVAATGDTGAVASLGADGVAARQPDGTWTRVGVLGAHRPTPPPSPALKFAALAFGPVLAGGILLLGRRRWPAWRAALVVAVVGWVGSLWISGAVGFVSDPDSRAYQVAFAVGVVVTVVGAVLVGRSRRFARRPPDPAQQWAALPPPPDSPASP